MEKSTQKFTQKEMVLLQLQIGEPITPMEALQEYGCFRLSHIIYVLRHEGWDIKTETCTMINKLGGVSHYAKYSLVEKEGSNES